MIETTFMLYAFVWATCVRSRLINGVGIILLETVKTAAGYHYGLLTQQPENNAFEKIQ